MLELDHLTVSGDVTFGKGVSLKVSQRVILALASGDRLGMKLVSQAQPTSAKEGKGLVNCVYKPCPTGMQLAE